MRVVGRAHERLGPPELPAERPRLQGRLLRRLRRGLAARLRRPRAVLRPRRGLRRHHRASPRASTSCPTAASIRRWACTCAETHLRERVKDKLGLDRHARPRRQHHASRSTAAPPCHYCGPCDRGCVDQLVLQLRLHHRRRRARKTGNCTHVPNAMVYKVLTDTDTQPRDGRALHRPRHARAEGGPRHGRGAVRAGPGVGAHPAQLDERAEPRRPRQLERRARPLPDGPPLGRRRRAGRVPRARRRKPVARRPAPAERHLRHPLPQHEERPEVDKASSAATASRAAGRPSFNWSAPGFGEAFKKGRRDPVPRRWASPASASACPTSRTTSRSTRRAR